MAKVSVLVLPYASATGDSLAKMLVDHLSDPQWTDFTAAVAFLNSSGNSQQLVEAMLAFIDRGGRLDLTFGADSFGEEMGSDFQALRDLLEAMHTKPNVHLYLYREPGRIFHPKVYLFHNPKRAVLIVGSSNWSHGGLVNNIEANVVIQLELDDGEDNKVFTTMLEYFVKYWRQP
jgi:HKD family nuclease